MKIIIGFRIKSKQLLTKGTLVSRNTTPQKSTEKKTDETKKGANKD